MRCKRKKKQKQKKKSRKLRRKFQMVNSNGSAGGTTANLALAVEESSAGFAKRRTNLKRKFNTSKRQPQSKRKASAARAKQNNASDVATNAPAANDVESVIIDDGPSSASAKKARKETFQKFRDIRSAWAGRGGNQYPSNANIVTRKLLRSIKRRQLQAHNTPHVKRTTLRRKLSFPDKSTLVQKSKLQNGQLKTKQLGDGRDAVNSVEGNATANPSKAVDISDDYDDNDDDCIVIEADIEQIVIDDEQPTTSSHLPRSNSTSIAFDSATGNEAARTSPHLVTSTPLPKEKKTAADVGVDAGGYKSNDGKFAASSPHRSQDDTGANSTPLFFDDRRPSAWFDTIQSADTFANYSKLSTLRPVSNKKRRSQRLNGNCESTTMPDVIVLDDTLTNDVPASGGKRKSTEMDDSVMFVSETNAAEPTEFIPLESARVPNPIARNTAKKQCVTLQQRRPDLFTKSEKKQLTAYNNNTYNPSAGTEAPTTKRRVIIDGSNVAYNHALNQAFSVKGLQICIDYFEMMGHEVKAIVPQFRLQKMKSTDPEGLEKLHRAGKVVLTPCKNLPGKSSSSYDDRFILQLACELDAAVVSNDNYRDLIHENSAFKKIIENRVIGYTWCNDIFILPKDPYGRLGPSLDSILN